MSELRLQTTTGAPGSSILGIGDYRPSRVVPNADIVEAIDSSDEWIRDRSGIAERRVANENETIVYMAAKAAQAALDHADIAAEKVDQVILASVTYPTLTPAAAPLVATELGITGAAAYDLSAACSGYTYGIAAADSAIRTGLSTCTLVIGVEKFSDFRNPTDRGTAFIFGDGAGAALVGPSPVAGIAQTIWGADGKHSDFIAQEPNWLEYRRRVENPNATDEERRWPWIGMQGPSVFRWASYTILDVARQALTAAGVTVNDIDVFIPHQANVRIIEAMAKKLELPSHVIVAREDIAEMANTSAASIPLATARLYREGRIRSGMLALQMGFGAGLTWAAQVVRLP
ncbi:3-oxoacyl-[acyl-carrier-protein] synthase 3 [Dermatophilus congolensis]|uniref:Beta-ketoacyl-[acyl-carrier-protein] synthase III n=1 Tax=Dermatophilus congolensis TaxID=1863 RepID=A0AA46H084_9MICO|nr:beta-ketoacyl-ACP synthase III [Dermatophilus congolensis]STD08122.1 3-oxoacyl-[acyl-carrier-protein] synthase 3 [Dermatophilus congolensis]